MDIAGAIKRAAKEVNAWAGDPHAKGDLFESYCSKLFHDDDFLCLHQTIKQSDTGEREVKELEDPDYRFQHRKTGHKFWVECKFRGGLNYEGKIGWCEDWQLERYRKFQTSHKPEKVYVVIGLRGMPSMPDSMYCVPLDKMEYPDTYPTRIEKYERNPRERFKYNLKNLLR